MSNVLNPLRNATRLILAALLVAGATLASANVAKSRITSDYASVTEQSGIKAGDGGFNVTVKGDTTLIGAVITSTDKAATEGKQIETEHTIGIVVLIANVSGH